MPPCLYWADWKTNVGEHGQDRASGREGQAKAGKSEVRGIYATPENAAKIKVYAKSFELQTHSNTGKIS